MSWKPIEEMVREEPIWVLKYDIYFYPEGHEHYGNFCEKDAPGAVKFTDCHGWYETEAEALAVQRHFTDPSGYHLEKVWRRRLLAQPSAQGMQLREDSQPDPSKQDAP